jgi:hypothetical protein
MRADVGGCHRNLRWAFVALHNVKPQPAPELIGRPGRRRWNKSLRARELIGVPKRKHLAAGLDRVLRAAAARPHPWRTAVPLNRREVVAAGEELAALAERLRADSPVPVRAVALAAVLVDDGASPLYDREAPRSVWRLAREARRALDGPIV